MVLWRCRTDNGAVRATMGDLDSLIWHALTLLCCVPSCWSQCHRRSRSPFPIWFANNCKTHQDFPLASSNAYAASSRCTPSLAICDHRLAEIYPKYEDRGSRVSATRWTIFNVLHNHSMYKSIYSSRKKAYSLLKNDEKPLQCVKYWIASALVHLPFQLGQEFVHYLVMVLYKAI